MTIRKTLTPKALRANQENAKKSAGPRTPAGKNRSRLNAARHGFYASELFVSDKDKAEFEQLRSRLSIQLPASSVLEELARERVIACAWRCVLALRLEQKGLGARLSNMNSSDESQLVVTPKETSWLQHRDEMRFLSPLREDLAQNGLLYQAQWAEPVVRLLGQKFLDTLVYWAPTVSETALLVAEQLEAHAKTFKKELPELAPPDHTAMKDPHLQQHMLVKLVELEMERRSALPRGASMRKPRANSRWL